MTGISPASTRQLPDVGMTMSLARAEKASLRGGTAGGAPTLAGDTWAGV